MADYKVPKDNKKVDSETRKIQDEGCAPNVPGHEQKPLPPLRKEPSPIKIKEEEDLDFKMRLPERLPIGIKTEIKEERVTPERVCITYLYIYF